MQRKNDCRQFIKNFNFWESLILKLIVLKSLKQKSQKRKRFWVKRIYLERQQKGESHFLVREMMVFVHENLFKCFRMTPSTYDQLLGWLAPSISKESTKMRESIGAMKDLLSPNIKMLMLLGSYQQCSQHVIIHVLLWKHSVLCSRFVLKTCACGFCN